MSLNSISLPDGTRYVREARPDILPNEAGWYRYQVRHDWQTSLWDFKPREVAPDPEVNRFGEFNDRTSFDSVPLNSEMQYFWAELLWLK